MPTVDVDRIVASVSLTGASSYIRQLEDIAEAWGVYDKALTKSQRQSATVAIAAGAAGVGIGAGIAHAVKRAGDLEQIEIGFKSIFGSAEAARAKIAEVQAFAARSPFDFETSAQAARNLSAAGIAAQDLIPIMEAAGNATSAAGGDSEVFKGVLRALGQIKTNGRALREEFGQLAERGIPAFQILKEELGLTEDALANLGNQGIPAAKALEALQRGFNRKFGGAMAEQSRSLRGSFSTLKDSTDQLAMSIGRFGLGPATGAVRLLTGLVDVANKLPEPLKAIGFGAGVVAAGGLVVYSGRVLLAIKHTLDLAKAQLEAAAAANVHATALNRVSGISLAGHGAAARAQAAKNRAAAGVSAAAGVGAVGAGAAAAGAGGVGALLKSRGTLLGLAAAVAADVALHQVPNDASAAGGLARLGRGVLEGGAVGAGLGMFGGAGGAVVGGLVGAIAGAVGATVETASIREAGKKDQTPVEKKLDQLIDAVNKQTGVIERSKGKMPLNTQLVPGQEQALAVQMGYLFGR